MTLRIQFAIGVAVAAIIIPIIVVQAQSEGEVVPPAESAPATEPAAAAETPTTEAAPAEAVAVEEEAAPTGEETQTETPVAEGEVLGAEDVTAPEAPAAAPGSDETETASTTLMTDIASSTATSTPPVEEPKPVEEPFVLQPGVALSINGSTLSAAITLENLTCRVCEKVLPELEVLAYYTPWYPNDGPLEDYAEASAKSAVQARSVADLPNMATRDLTWSAEVPPGHYYFVVEVDPENTNGAYRLFRSEFAM